MSDPGTPGPGPSRPWWEQQLGQEEEPAAAPAHEEEDGDRATARHTAPPRRFPPTGRPPAAEPAQVPPFGEPPRHVTAQDARGPRAPAFATDSPPPHDPYPVQAARPPAATRSAPPPIPVATLDAVDDLLQRRTDAAGGVPDPRLAAFLDAARGELATLHGASAPAASDMVLWRLAVPGSLVGLGRGRSGTDGSPSLARCWLGHLLVAIGVVILAGQGSAAPPWFVAWFGSPWPVTPWGLGTILLAAQLVLLTAEAARGRAAVRHERSLAQLEADLAEPLRELRAAAALRGPTHDVLDTLDELRDTVDALRTTLPEAARHTTELARQTPPVADLARVTLEAAEQVRSAVAAAAAQLERTAALAEREADHTAAVEAGERPLVVAATQIEAAAGQLAASVTRLEESVREMESAMARADWLALVADGLRHDWAHGGGRPDPRSS